jgi:hypothetical protein
LINNQFSGMLENVGFERVNFMSDKIYGLLILPYQYMQIIGYRLSGVPCRRRFATFGVEPLKPITRSQRLLSIIPPLIAVGVGWVLQIGIIVYLARLYQANLPVIPLLFVLVSTPPLALYTHYVRFDLKQQGSAIGQSGTSQHSQN